MTKVKALQQKGSDSYLVISKKLSEHLFMCDNGDILVSMHDIPHSGTSVRSCMLKPSGLYVRLYASNNGSSESVNTENLYAYDVTESGGKIVFHCVGDYTGKTYHVYVSNNEKTAAFANKVKEIIHDNALYVLVKDYPIKKRAR